MTISGVSHGKNMVLAQIMMKTAPKRWLSGKIVSILSSTTFIQRGKKTYGKKSSDRRR